MGYQKYVAAFHRGLKKKTKGRKDTELRALMQKRRKTWRRGPAVARHERPIRIDRARSYGYKAKQGFVVARARVRRGGLRKSRPVRGRRPKRMGVAKITAAKSTQRIAEERASKRFPNLEVLGSYLLTEDGQYKWYEIVLVDPHHPAVRKDKDVGWIGSGKHQNRSVRGLTPAGRKGRGQRRKGQGAEKVRPSIRAKGRMGK